MFDMTAVPMAPAFVLTRACPAVRGARHTVRSSLDRSRVQAGAERFFHTPRRLPGVAGIGAKPESVAAAGVEQAESHVEVQQCTLDSFLSTRSAVALLGWTVVLHDVGSTVGTVAEVLSAAGGEVVFDVSGGAESEEDATLDPLADLLVLGALPGAQDDAPENVLLRVQGAGREYPWHVFVPLVPALVHALEPGAKVVRITPPAGLLELGERPHLMAWLKQQLLPYLGPQPAGGTTGARPQRMPRRSELLKQGRPDLVDHISRAGGFAAVGAQLRLRGARKPPGYWDDIDILASELREFVDAHWTMHCDAAAADGDDQDEPYWYNDITGQLRWDPPPAALAGSESDDGAAFDDDGDDDADEDEDEDDFATDLVMPPLRALIAGRRWDLASAVRMHGGSRAVAEQLGWTPAPRWGGRHLAAFDTLADELRAFRADLRDGLQDGADDTDDDGGDAHEDGGSGGGAASDDQLEVMPTLAELRAAGRSDLIEAVRRHGGATAVAARLGWRLTRSPKGRWASPAVTAREMRAFMRSRGKGAPANRLPTRSELIAAGRHDLVYALARHGTAAVAAKLKLAPRRGRSVRPFADAREFARALKLRGQVEWRAWCRTGARPHDIPASPAVAYKDSGWTSWGDFLTADVAARVRPRRRNAAAIAALAKAIERGMDVT